MIGMSVSRIAGRAGGQRLLGLSFGCADLVVCGKPVAL